MDKSVIREILERKFVIKEEKRYKKYAWRFTLENNATVYCGDKGNIWYSGKNKKVVEEYLTPLLPPIYNNKVFIVYGHDKQAKTELILLLKEWDLEPLYIDSLPNQGRTIIEQLEHYIPQTNFGIVLATPDDKGCLAEKESELMFRVRQNVVLELGMLFSKLGRSRVAIIIKKVEKFEKPSDIDGVLYLEYKESVREISDKLKKELDAQGYKCKNENII